MKNLIFIFALTITHSSFSQKRSVESFTAIDNNFEYIRFDCSMYGVNQMYIIMYEENPSTQLVRQNAIKYLKDPTIYHSFYYFIVLPQGKYNQEQKEKIFDAFAKHIPTRENLHHKELNLYLKSDFDYSKIYRQEVASNPELTNLKRVTIDINSKNIYKKLRSNK